MLEVLYQKCKIIGFVRSLSLVDVSLVSFLVLNRGQRADSQSVRKES